jgi:hypothetical protein
LRYILVRLHNECLHPQRDNLTRFALLPVMDTSCVFWVVARTDVEADTQMEEDIAVENTVASPCWSFLCSGSGSQHRD